MQRPDRYATLWALERVSALKIKAHRKMARMVREMRASQNKNQQP
jgi:hypothetical protein